jgi:tetratricopeptide (TPR) repeat protein
MKRFATILILLAVLALRARAADAAADFDSANKLYAEGKYSAAADLYEKIAAGGPASPALLFNLGNAAYKSGQTGRAIAAYARAERMSPRDPDVRANLRFARNQLSGGDSVHPDWCERLLGRLTLNEWAVWASVFFWLWLGLLAAREWKPAWRPALRQFTLLAGAGAVVLWLGTGGLWFDRHANPRAVVVGRDVAVRGGPLEDAQTVYTAPDGVELTVLDKRDDWLQVGDGHQRIGWLKRDAVQTL